MIFSSLKSGKSNCLHEGILIVADQLLISNDIGFKTSANLAENRSKNQNGENSIYSNFSMVNYENNDVHKDMQLLQH
jgi:hypothetical protein